VLLLALLTLPPPWAGLQPIDAVILTAAFILYFARATVGEGVDLGYAKALCRTDVVHAAIGLGAIAAGAVVAVLASRRLNDTLGIPDLVGGLFITGMLCALPECFAVWRLAQHGQATGALVGAMGDGITSLTIALVPCALVGLPLGDLPIYVASLGFVALCLAFYVLANDPRWGERLTLAKVAAYGGGYAAYVAIVLFVTRA
jgi:cation:H+ antiporter